AYSPQSPAVLIGNPSTTGLSIEGAALSLELRTAGISLAEGIVALKVETLRGSIDFSAGDGFLSTITSGLKGTTEFGRVLGWSSKRGLYFDGGGGLRKSFPLHLVLGPLNIDSVDVEVEPDGNNLTIVAAATAGLVIGPIAAAVQKVGVSLKLASSTTGE